MVSMDKEMRDGVCVVRLAGEMDVSGTGDVRSSLLHTIDEVDGPAVFELSGVKYMGSLGLALLAEAANNAKTAGRTVAFCGLRAPVRQVFRITHLEQTYAVYADLDHALAALGVGPEPEGSG